MRLSIADKALLLSIARQRIGDYFSTGKSLKKPEKAVPETLQIHCGAFVSLYIGGHLRGCIGTFSENEMLVTNVRNMALSAATTDTRFAPINATELEELKIEISVLSPRKKVSGPEEIIVGKHGIYIKSGENRGTLLPQVAVTQNWSVEQFLGNCSKYKAGLDWDGWRYADLFTYEAIVFSSEEIRAG
ncbi:MAG: AmmeMemoRadiSam system protein A [Bacteroidota bacterium]